MTTKMNTNEQKILADLAAIRDQLAGMSASSSSMKKMKQQKQTRKPKDPNAPPRPPNAWIVFTGRVRSVLKAANLGAGKECQQFASHLKSTNPNAYEMEDSEILKARTGWVAPPPKPKESKEPDAEPEPADSVPQAKPKRTLTEEQKAKMAAGRKAAAEKKKTQSAATEEPPHKTLTAPAATPAPAAAKKFRVLPFKGKRYHWDQETMGLWTIGPDGSTGDWVGVLAADRKSIDTTAPNPESDDVGGDDE
jgi:hypothetical protein